MEGSPHILMFGGTGRIGPAVLDELKQTNLITLFSRTVRNDLVAPHRVIQCDIRDTEATTRAVQIALSTHSCSPTRPLAILYMATEGILEKTSRPIDDEFAVAVGGLNTVVNAVADHTPLPDDIAVLFVSSLAVETFPRAGLEYVVGKAAGEQYCRHMARNPPKGNWRFNVLRIGRVSVASELTTASARLADFLLGSASRGISGQVFSACSPTSE